MRFPIGAFSFRDVIDSGDSYIDKTLFDQEVFQDSSRAVLLLRPRRFGKTLNLSMLHHFLSHEVDGKSTSHLFNNLKITESAHMKEQGQHIVLSVTFKDMKQPSYESAISDYRLLISSVYKKYSYLLSSDKLDDAEKNMYRSICSESSELIKLQKALYILSGYLERHHDSKVWLLMDEYDTPLLTAYEYGYYDDMCSFMRGCMSQLVKDNPYLYKAVITGILRVSKESLFSGMNNLKVCSMLDKKYAEHFGFTQSEVDDILKNSGLSDNAEKVQHWYNGYSINGVTLYNPWSISQYVDSEGEFDLYWVNTADDSLLRKMIITSKDSFKELFEVLLFGGDITVSIDLNVTFKNIMGASSAIWSFLYLSGHLRVLNVEDRDDERLITVNLPNREIIRLMKHIIYTWVSPDDSTVWFRGFIVSLLEGKVDQFEDGLRDIMNQTVSCHDVARTPECFYHGLMMGMRAYLYNHACYKLESNRESGKGRFDYMILSRDPKRLSILFEFKRLDAKKIPKKGLNDEEAGHLLELESAEAIKQIRDQDYLSSAIAGRAEKVLMVGLAFYGKLFHLRSEIVDLSLTYANASSSLPSFSMFAVDASASVVTAVGHDDVALKKSRVGESLKRDQGGSSILTEKADVSIPLSSSSMKK